MAKPLRQIARSTFSSIRRFLTVGKMIAIMLYRAFMFPFTPQGDIPRDFDVIDLHSIPPQMVRAVVEDYLEEAHRRGYKWVRIIHGKGIGVQREMVRSILDRTPFVIDFNDAPPEAGGWGATIVTLKNSVR
jgi:Smr domain